MKLPANETIDVLMKRGDSTVTVMAYVTRDLRGEYDPSDEAIAAHIQKHFPDTIEWRRVKPGESFTFAASYSDPYFGAWSYGNGAITHDIAKARDIYRNMVRLEREPLLAALDLEYQRADEADDKDAKRAIAAQKQRLRDATADPRIEQAQSVEELVALDVLG